MPYRLLLLAALLGACGVPQDRLLDVTYDPCATIVLVSFNASPSERESIRDAAHMWNVAAQTKLSVEAVEGAAELHMSFEDAAPMFRGIYRDERGDIVINRALSNQRHRSVVMAHEIGHALGLWHVAAEARPSVMNEGNLDVRPNAGDARALAETWGACD